MVKNYDCDCVLFTFRPREEEWSLENPLSNLIKYIDKIGNIYVLSYENGGKGEIPNHFHLYLRLEKSVRFDKLKDNLKKNLRKDYNVEKFNNEKVSFDFTKITTEHYKKYYYGYVLKESFKKIRFNSLTNMEEECIKYYEENKTKKDIKIHLNNKNIHMYLLHFVQDNNISPINDNNYEIVDFGNILDRMLENGYYVGSLSEKSLLHLGRIGIGFLNYKFYGIPIIYFTELIEKLLEKEKNYDF